MMPRSLAMAVLMPIGGRFYNGLGPRVLVGGGLLIAASGSIRRRVLYDVQADDKRGILGSLLAAAMAGSRVQSDLRRSEHRRLVDDSRATDDGGDGSL